MRKRYKNTKINKNSKYNKGVRKNLKFTKYGTTIYGTVPESNNDIYVITQEGDRLDNLAFQFYGHPSLWWFIANVNNLNTMNIKSGTRLRIPTNIDQASAY
tara:strand:+ start:6014 stop:6316 length:303 start_codon:yes stop_codon:yes gene_type:complete